MTNLSKREIEELSDYALPAQIPGKDEAAFRHFVSLDLLNRSPALGNAQKAVRQFLAEKNNSPRWRDKPRQYWDRPVAQIFTTETNQEPIQLFNRVGGGYIMRYREAPARYVPRLADFHAYAATYFSYLPIFKDDEL